MAEGSKASDVGSSGKMKMPFGLLDKSISDMRPTDAGSGCKPSDVGSGCKPSDVADSGCQPDDVDVVAGGSPVKDDEGDQEYPEEDVGRGPALPEDSDVWDSMPSGERLGIMGIDIAPGSSAKCWLCVSKFLDNKACSVRKGSVRLWYRLKPGQAEKSLHVSCVTDGSVSGTLRDLQLKHSMMFLRRHKHSDSFTDDLKEAMENVLAAMTALVGEG